MVLLQEQQGEAHMQNDISVYILTLQAMRVEAVFGISANAP
jgi:hypothetical protein